MTPTELRQANIDRYVRMLASEADPEKQTVLEKLLEEEWRKPDSAYPVSRPKSARCGSMRTFSCFTFDNKCSLPALFFVIAANVARARVLARRELLATEGAVSVEIFENNKLLGIEMAEHVRPS